MTKPIMSPYWLQISSDLHTPTIKKKKKKKQKKNRVTVRPTAGWLQGQSLSESHCFNGNGT